jgi:hypothetical protein
MQSENEAKRLINLNIRDLSQFWIHAENSMFVHPESRSDYSSTPAYIQTTHKSAVSALLSTNIGFSSRTPAHPRNVYLVRYSAGGQVRSLMSSTQVTLDCHVITKFGPFDMWRRNLISLWRWGFFFLRLGSSIALLDPIVGSCNYPIGNGSIDWCAELMWIGKTEYVGDHRLKARDPEKSPRWTG